MDDRQDEDNAAVLSKTLIACEQEVGSALATAQDVESALARLKQRVKSRPAIQHGPSVQHIQRDPLDRSGARALFLELRTLQDGTPEYAELRNRLVR
ncbi:RNA polymerase sigma factor SigF, partial [Streptomyces hirsutus]